MSEKDWTKGFTKMVDKMPVVAFAIEFEKRMMKIATRRHGDIIPNDPETLYQLATETLETFKPKP